ncbi:MAG: M48 family metallopeptidase [Actinomycetota bacterium]
MDALVVDGIEVAVRRSARARRVRLVANPGAGVELVLPARGGDDAARALVRTHRAWIAEQHARLERRVLGLDRPGVVWRHGVAVPLSVRHAERGRILATDDRVVIAAPSAGDAGRLVERWYREHARTVALALVADLPEPHPVALRIADGRSRWGSCSRTGTVSLSWRLLLAPFAVLDYVVVHELCHLTHLDHGAGFWAAVEALRPDWRDAHDWLRAHGTELHAYDPAGAVAPLRIAA